MLAAEKRIGTYLFFPTVLFVLILFQSDLTISIPNSLSSAASRQSSPADIISLEFSQYQ